MPLIYRCDKCSAEAPGRRLPDGWGITWVGGEQGMAYACPVGRGVAPKPERRRRSAERPRGDGPMFGGGDHE